jgi:outer membrane protein assembly factor BamA
MLSVGMRLMSISVFLVVAALAAPGACAQAPPASAVIAEIHATGSARYTDAQVAAAAGLKVGDTVTRERLQAAADALVQIGIFSRVNYQFKTLGSKIVVEFQLADAPAVPVSFDNFPWFSDEELAAAIREAVPFYDGTAPDGGSLLDEIAAAVSRLLQAHGIAGMIEHTLLAQPASDDMTTQFHLDGPTLTVGSIQYGDSLAQASAQLQGRSQDLVGKPFSRFAIEVFEVEQVRPIYLLTGHLRVQFGAPVARFTGDPNKPLPSNVSVTLPVDPGPVFHLSQVSWSGNNALDNAALSSLFASQPNDLADGMKLADAWQRIEKEYGRRGYIHAKIEPQAQFDDAAATVSYRVAITEGSQYRMGGLVITGLSLDGETAVRAAWRLAPGQIFDGAYCDDMLVRLEKPTSEIFGPLPVHYAQVGHLLREDDKAHTVDVLIDFE